MIHYEMAALGAAYKALVVLLGAVSFEISENLIHPGACDVHRNRGAGRVSPPPKTSVNSTPFTSPFSKIRRSTFA